MGLSYSYRAFDAAGAVRTGHLLAASRGGALEALTRQGLVPVELRESSTGKATRVQFRLPRWGERSGANRREFLTFTQSLAALLTAGLTVERALQISTSLAPN